MKISSILYKEFKHAPTLSEFVDFVTCKKKFWEEHRKICFNEDDFILKPLLLIRDYNNFLKQPIELKMLVPCKDGEVLSNEYEKLHNELLESGATKGVKEQHMMQEYQKAKEDVLFSGFEMGDKEEIKEWGELCFGINIQNVFYTLITILQIDGKMVDSDYEEEVLLKQLTGQPITENYFKFLD